MTIKYLNIFVFSLFLFFHYPTYSFPQNVTENVRKEINDYKDKHNLRYRSDFVVDSSYKLLIPHTNEMTIKDFIISKSPPNIYMMIIPELEPSYFFNYTKGRARWSNWAKPARSDKNRFFLQLEMKENMAVSYTSTNIIHMKIKLKKS